MLYHWGTYTPIPWEMYESVNSRGVGLNVVDCDSGVSEFELQSPWYVHFRTNTLEKGMNPLIHPSYGLNSPTTVLLPKWFGH